MPVFIIYPTAATFARWYVILKPSPLSFPELNTKGYLYLNVRIF